MGKGVKGLEVANSGDRSGGGKEEEEGGGGRERETGSLSLTQTSACAVET